MPTVNAGGIYNHIFMGSKPKPLLQVKQTASLFHFGEVQNTKRYDNTSDKCLLWHFPHGVDAKKSRKIRLLCPLCVLSLLYRWVVTVLQWQKLCWEKKKIQRIISIQFFCSSLQSPPLFPPLKMLFSFSAYLFSRLLFFLSWLFWTPSATEIKWGWLNWFKHNRNTVPMTGI